MVPTEIHFIGNSGPYLHDLGLGAVSGEEDDEGTLLLLLPTAGVPDAADRGALDKHVAAGGAEEDALKAVQLLLLDEASDEAEATELGSIIGTLMQGRSAAKDS